MIALIVAADVAVTLRFPSALIVESSITALAVTACSLPIALAPSSVSTAWNRMFWTAQPTVLIARVPVPDVAPALVDAIVRALIRDVFSALTTTSPPLPAVVVMLLSLTRASVVDRTRFVAITALTASEESSPNAELPFAVTSLSMMAWIDASSTASTVTVPPAFTFAFKILLSTSVRTSFRTTRPPTASPSLSPMSTTAGTDTGTCNCQ